jgi:hypothetical protein
LHCGSGGRPRGGAGSCALGAERNIEFRCNLSVLDC